MGPHEHENKEYDILSGKELDKWIKQRKQEKTRLHYQIGDSPGHPLWAAVLFIVLFVIFFPWSILFLLLVFGWDGSVQIFRGLVLGTLGLAAFVLCLIISLAILLVIVGLAYRWLSGLA